MAQETNPRQAAEEPASDSRTEAREADIDVGGSSATHSGPETQTNADIIEQTASNLDITDQDVIIAVMGLTGVGKSTFIKYLSDSEIKIGHTLDSCTVHVAVHPFVLDNGRRGFLIDTPGFDDQGRKEAEILEQISNFFAATYKLEIKLAGVIYLHRISDNRMTGSMLKNLKMLKKLCGEDCFPRIVLATTMWDLMNDKEKAIQNEQQLGDTHDWWGELQDGGATIFRQDDRQRSAAKIVDYVLSFRTPAIMANQIERVDKNLALMDCESGKVIAEELIKQQEEHEKVMQEKREEYEAQIRAGRTEAAEKLAKLEDKHEKHLRRMNREHAILSKNFKESNAALQEQINKHKEEIEDARQASVNANAALKKAEGDLATFRVEQVKKQEEWQVEKTKLREEMNDRLQEEQDKIAKMGIDMKAKYEAPLEEAQARRSTKGPWAMIGGALTSILGAVTLNPPLVATGVAIWTGGGVKTVYDITK